MSSLSIEVLSDRLVIRDPCSGSSVTYRRGFERGARIADGLLRHDPSQAELSFLAAAWKAAYAEAKAFGWLWHYTYWASGPTQRPLRHSPRQYDSKRSLWPWCRILDGTSRPQSSMSS
jgi:hypothetical protein